VPARAPDVPTDLGGPVIPSPYGSDDDYFAFL